MSTINSPPTRSSTALSRSLTSILRHRAPALGLEISPAGFVSLDSIVQLREIARFSPTLEFIQTIVKECPKQRLNLRLKGNVSTSLSSSDLKLSDFEIAANQGHSFEISNDSFTAVTKEFLQLNPFEASVHGTFFIAWSGILKSGGLSPCSRQFIHFATRNFKSAEMRSGMRRDCDILIHIDINRAIDDGIEFFLSSNEVLLSRGLKNSTGEWIFPLKYFSRVEILLNGNIEEEMKEFQLPEKYFKYIENEEKMNKKIPMKENTSQSNKNNHNQNNQNRQKYQTNQNNQNQQKKNQNNQHSQNSSNRSANSRQNNSKQSKSNNSSISTNVTEMPGEEEKKM